MAAYAIAYNDGTLNRLDRLTAANYGMPINTNLCEKQVRIGQWAMHNATSRVYLHARGRRPLERQDMIEIMLDVARTSLSMIGKRLV